MCVCGRERGRERASWPDLNALPVAKAFSVTRGKLPMWPLLLIEEKTVCVCVCVLQQQVKQSPKQAAVYSSPALKGKQQDYSNPHVEWHACLAWMFTHAHLKTCGLMLIGPVDTAGYSPHTMFCSVVIKGTPWIIFCGHTHLRLH